METKIVVERRVKKRLQAETLKAQLKQMAAVALKGSRGKGWDYTTPARVNPPYQDGEFICYKQTVKFHTTINRESVKQKFPQIAERFAQAGCAGQLKTAPWVVLEPTGLADIAHSATKAAAEAAELREKANEPREIGEVNLTQGKHFSHIYGRQAQINRIMGALRLGEKTDWNKRTNSVLDGDPGCGKTEIMRACAKMLGKEDEAYMWVDATSTTKAGMLERLLSGEVVPPVMFIEEIEKCEEQALRWLLGVMDIRGQVRRHNYRTGPQCENVKMVVIATANDVDLLEKMMAGALYSRFQNKIYCPRPDRKIMERILKREVKEIGGREEWIEPALVFGMDKWAMTDPRDLITICSCGGDDLLGAGNYQKDYEETMHPKVKAKLLAAKNERDSAKAA